MIVSHHGELEFGSPKVPLFPEALLLHHLDNLDSKMECMRRQVANDRHVEGCWTAYNPSLDRSVLKKARYLDEEPSETGAGPGSIEASPPDPPSSATAPPPAPHGHQEPGSQPASLFAEKLQQAWRKEP